MSPEFNFLNAKIKALKSDLLTNQYIEYLISLPNLQEVIVSLTSTIYKDDIEAGIMRNPGLKGVEDGLKMNLVKSFNKILAADDPQIRTMAKIFLDRYDIYNIKTILRGKHANVSAEDILAGLVPAGSMSDHLLGELAKERAVKDVIDLLGVFGSPYIGVLLRAYNSYVDTGSLAELEVSLDKHYYASAISLLRSGGSDSVLLMNVIRREIDFVNIMTLMKLFGQSVGADELLALFIDGGKYLDRELFIQLEQKRGLGELIDELKFTPYYEALIAKMDEYETTGAISVIERSFEEFIIRNLSKLFLSDPLQAGYLVAYVWLKMNEVTNLRIILTGKEIDMPAEIMQEGMILV